MSRYCSIIPCSRHTLETPLGFDWTAGRGCALRPLRKREEIRRTRRQQDCAGAYLVAEVLDKRGIPIPTFPSIRGCGQSRPGMESPRAQRRSAGSHCQKSGPRHRHKNKSAPRILRLTIIKGHAPSHPRGLAFQDSLNDYERSAACSHLQSNHRRCSWTRSRNGGKGASRAKGANDAVGARSRQAVYLCRHELSCTLTPP
nr:hypothetical protein CFP56_09524 [Quercus suber]